MKYLVHENLPFMADYLQRQEQENKQDELILFSGRIPPTDALAQADVLLIRSTTQVDQALIDAAPQLRFIGTGTVGMDHMDLSLLQDRGIAYANAPGANAIAVGEYVLAACLTLAQKAQVQLAGKKALVIGAGHTGTQAGQRLEALGMQVRYIDPNPVLPKRADQLTTWGALPEADVVTCHVPLITAQQAQATQEQVTGHLLGAEQLAQLKDNCLLINASRGAVVDNQALASVLYERQGQPNKIWTALDVWEGEPAVYQPLIDLVDIGTAHIAGHSIEGKIRGSYLLYLALHQHFAWPSPVLDEALFMPPAHLEAWLWPEQNKKQQSLWYDWVRACYDIEADSNLFKQQAFNAAGFDSLRKGYQRREYSAQRVQMPLELQGVAEKLGFQLELI